MPPPAPPGDPDPATALADPGRAADAFDRLYSRHAAALLAFARSRFGPHADDLCQTAWLAAIQHQWAAGDNVRAWLFQVVHNQGVSAVRKAGRATDGLAADAAGPADDPLARLLAGERAARVRRCRELLAERNPGYATVVAAFLDGERPEDAARRLGISRANFDQRKKRALDALGRCVDPDREAGGP